jgi:hypothetical protein
MPDVELAPLADGAAGHLVDRRTLLVGGTAGYRSFVGRVRPLGVTMTFALNAQDDPTPLVIPVVQALAATHR